MARPGAPTVEISNNQRLLPVDEAALAALAHRVCALEALEGGSVSVAIVDDPTIHALNARHLGHDWPTDVITFDLREPGDDEPSGELVVSAETAIRVARNVEVDPAAELALYIVHGLLHLAGHDDIDEADRARMRDREAEIMADLGIPHPGASPADGVHGPPYGRKEAPSWSR
jgi:probable rRNA maturation factor